MLNLGLSIIFLMIVLLPFLSRKIEEELEVFLFIMGVSAVTLTHFEGEPLWSGHLIKEALIEPIKISAATLVFGLLFRAIRNPLRERIVRVEHALGARLFAFILIFSLGLISSVITAIISALVLCEIMSALNLDKKYETIVVILACFSIGMGAALTPIGEPLSTIAVSKLNGDFFYLLRLIGVYVISGIAFVSALGAFFRGNEVSRYESLTEDFAEPNKVIILRAIKVYVFVMALIFLGTGFKPIIDNYIIRLPGAVLYWINISSAVLDNATLVAAELSPKMELSQIKGILMATIISGGILIPGNIPNIISASKLRIKSRAWAVVGAPIGLLMMMLYFLILYIF